MKKKLLTVIVACFMCVFVLCGCNLVERNDYKYYNQVVAKTDEYSFTMKDLLQSYNMYGTTYVEDEEMTYKEAIEQTVKDMINRKLLVEKIVGDNLVDYNGVAFETAYKQDILREVYSAINEQLLSIEDEVRIDWDIDPIVINEEETEEISTGYTAYDKSYGVEKNDSNEWIIVKDSIEETIKPNMTPAGDFVQTITDDRVSAEAWNRYIKDLKEASKDLGENVTKEDELLQGEIDRLYEIYRANKVLSLYQTIYEYNESINVDSIINYYKSLYLTDYEKYKQTNETTTEGLSANATRLANYVTAITGDEASNVRYYANSDYVQVSHILLKFSDEQANALATFKESNKNSYNTQEEYNNAVEEYRNNLVGSIRVEGKSVNEIYNTVLAECQPDNSFRSLYSKADSFNTLMYQYTGDPGLNNASIGYIVPLNEDAESKYVAEFTETSRALAQENADGGNIQMAVTDYGVHIIMNLGVLNNVVEPVITTTGTDISITLESLSKTRLYPMNNKTLLDLCYEKVVSSTYSEHASNLILEARGEQSSIKTYKSRYENLWK